MAKVIYVKKPDDVILVTNFFNQIGFSKPLKVVISEDKQTRTAAQNRLMHMWFNHISEHYQQTIGEAYSPMAFKELLKRQFLGFDLIDLPNGETVAQTKSTRDCNTKELTDFLQKIEVWALTEISCQLPHPEDLYWQAMGIK